MIRLESSDVLNQLEKLKIISSTKQWDRLREIRNTLAHEYPMCEEERIENIGLVLESYEELKLIYDKLKNSYYAIR